MQFDPNPSFGSSSQFQFASGTYPLGVGNPLQQEPL